MLYNWECCSFYPNNFGASALKVVDQVSSTGLWTCFHWPVETCTLACGNTSTAQWTTTHQPSFNNTLWVNDFS